MKGEKNIEPEKGGMVVIRWSLVGLLLQMLLYFMGISAKSLYLNYLTPVRSFGKVELRYLETSIVYSLLVPLYWLTFRVLKIIVDHNSGELHRRHRSNDFRQTLIQFPIPAAFTSRQRRYLFFFLGFATWFSGAILVLMEPPLGTQASFLISSIFGGIGYWWFEYSLSAFVSAYKDK